VIARTLSTACHTSSLMGVIISVRPSIASLIATKMTVLPAPVNKELSVDLTPRFIASMLRSTHSR